jgi:FKBP-type peptidyl-prolyl cis-trans isomerase (trigger factor)
LHTGGESPVIIQEEIEMSQTVEKKEHNMAVITVEVPAEEFEKAVEKAYQRNKKSISVPGFRKGKVPRQLIEKMYGKEVFFEDAANICVPDAWEKAYDECEEEIVSSPKIDIKQIEAGKQSLAFSLWFRSDDHALTDKEVDQFVAKILKNLAKDFEATQR